MNSIKLLIYISSMKNWMQKLNTFLKFSEHGILQKQKRRLQNGKRKSEMV
jgi:hypothetical protein